MLDPSGRIRVIGSGELISPHRGTSREVLVDLPRPEAMRHVGRDRCRRIALAVTDLV